MRIATTGSLATDHLVVYPGRFADHLLSGHLETVPLSSLADELNVRRGGAAANIAVGLGRLGLDALHTARFVCTTDREQNQIATLYAGAMSAERSAQLGCSPASVVLESVGTQEYGLSAEDLLEPVDRGYGPAAAAAMAPWLRARLYSVPNG